MQEAATDDPGRDQAVRAETARAETVRAERARAETARGEGAGGEEAQPRLPVLPGFREMALRRMSQDRRRLVGFLAGQRRAAGMSQTEVAARMRTSQSAVARLEAGGSDVRASTLERYAAAIGCEISWQSKYPEGRR